MNRQKAKSHISKKRTLTPPQTITVSFIILILAGAFLLNLPAASKSGESIGFLDAVFTSTSAVCVTGLVVVNTLSHWSLFGKTVLLLLIQFGALGLMTVLTLIMIVFGKKISLKDRLVIQASYNQNNIGGMVRLVKLIVTYTAVIESIGAAVLSILFYSTGSCSLLQTVTYGIFHSVSAFCNAGFDIIGSDSLTPYRGHAGINLVIMLLIIAGGLGFVVLAELKTGFIRRKNKSLKMRLHHLSLHCKIALTVTAALIISGTLLFLLFEWTNPDTLGSLPAAEKLLAAAFQSVTLRTAGFNTIDQGALRESSQFIACIYMLIGGSSAGTAGGMKTVTIGVIIISMLSVLKGKTRIEAFGRTLPPDLLLKALTVVFTMLIVVISSVLILSFTEQGMAVEYSFLDLLFECASAAGTAGVSTGITSYLSVGGKIVIIICMFLGRLSPVTVVVALNMRLHASEQNLSYIDERVIIG